MNEQDKKECRKEDIEGRKDRDRDRDRDRDKESKKEESRFIGILVYIM
jgi:hypothetical protein